MKSRRAPTVDMQTKRGRSKDGPESAHTESAPDNEVKKNLILCSPGHADDGGGNGATRVRCG